MKQAPNATDLFIGQKIREFRRMRKVSQTDLGTALKITFQQIQKYEKGSNRISATNLHSVAVNLNIDIGNFFPISAKRACT